MRNFQYLWQKRKSIIVTWIVSYSVVLIIPIMISLMIYSQASSTLASEIHRANDSLLKQMRYTIDNQVDLMKRLNTEMSWNMQLQTLLYSNNPANEIPFLAYKVAKDFAMFKTSYATIDECYVYWQQEKSVIRPGNIRDMETAFSTLHDTGSMTYSEWEQAVNGMGTNKFIVWPRMNDGQAQTSIAYVTRLPKRLDGNEAGMSIVMIDIDRFQNAIENISGLSEGQLLILNEENDILVSNRSVDPEVNKMLNPFLKEGHVSLDLPDRGNSKLLFVRSEISDLKYAVIIPNSVYWKKAEFVRSFAYISIIISLVSATILTWFFLRRNYSPIQELVQTLMDKKSPQDRLEWNELRLIKQAVMNTRNEKDEVVMQLQKHQQVLRSNLLNRLMKGRQDSLISYEEAFESFQMKLHSDMFAVMLFMVENEDSLYAKLPGIDINEREKLIQFIIYNVLEELADKHGHIGYVTETNDMMVCLININLNSEDVTHDLNAIAAEAQEFLVRYEMELTVSLSGKHSSWHGISKCYQEAIDAMEYKMVLGKQGIISYEDIVKSEDVPTDFYYPLQAEQQLINFMKAGHFEHATSNMDEIFERNFNQQIKSLALTKTLLFNVAATMLKTMNELDGQENGMMERNAKWMEEIMACDTVYGMQERLKALLQEVCEAAESKRSANVMQDRELSLRVLTAKVTEYIEQNYSDPNLNVNAIGEHFELKGSYLSKLFKTHTGDGLLDCIHKFRIEKAKRLFKISNETIVETSKLAGYNDVATFIRVFKKYEGITPGKYKEID